MSKIKNENQIQDELSRNSVFFSKRSEKDSDKQKLINHESDPPGEKTILNYSSWNPIILDEIRKELRHFGKETATHRFTRNEKQTLTKIIYRFSELGIRTNENQITRIAVNFLINDHQTNKTESLLSKSLEIINQ